MPTPTPDSYTSASGQPIYGGRVAPALGLPAWRTGQAINAWVEIAGTAMSNFPPSVNPGRASGSVSAKMECWCGLSIDTRTNKVYSVANGGHDDYHGNEVDVFNLESDSPVWTEILRSNSAAEFTIPNTTARYSSGRPASIHSYYSQQYIEKRNRAMRFGLGAIATVGFGDGQVIDGFDTTVATGVDGWDPVGTWPTWPTFGTDMPVCKNPATEDVYAFNYNNAVYKWTEATNAISTVSSGYPPVTMQYAASAWDTVRSRIFLLSGSGACHTFDPSTGLFTAQTLSGSASGTAPGNQRAMVYVPALDAYLVVDGSSVIYRIDASTFEAVVPTVVGSPTPTHNDSGSKPYGRLLLAPNLQGVVWFPLYTANAWFLRTH